ncbi:motility associated factor glycosyltransferase family protein [candidate division KSB1 bacterium]
MSGYYDANMKILTRRWPRIAAELKEAKAASGLEIQTSRAGLPTALLETGEGKIRLHSTYDPSREAQRFVQSNRDSQKPGLVIFGLGFGYCLPAWRLDAGPDEKLYAIDCRPDIFHKALELVDLSRDLADGRLQLLVTADESAVMRFIQSLSAESLPVALASFFGPLQPEGSRLAEMLERFRLDSFLPETLTALLSENIRENRELTAATPPINDLFGRFARKPAFIASAGPSLSKNAPYLSQAGQTGLVMTATTSLQHLLSLDIKPDFVGLTDPSRHVRRHFVGLEKTDIPLIFLPTASPDALRMYPGPKWVGFQREHPEAAELAGGKELIETGGSVATFLLDLAIRFGCDPIVFLGQDLAYTGDMSHAREINVAGSPWEKKRPLDGFFAEDVASSMKLLRYLRWMENRISQERTGRFLNATEGGAAIRGAAGVSLRDILNSLKAKQ